MNCNCKFNWASVTYSVAEFNLHSIYILSCNKNEKQGLTTLPAATTHGSKTKTLKITRITATTHSQRQLKYCKEISNIAWYEDSCIRPSITPDQTTYRIHHTLIWNTQSIICIMIAHGWLDLSPTYYYAIMGYLAIMGYHKVFWYQTSLYLLRNVHPM